jgi:competence protein ComEC
MAKLTATMIDVGWGDSILLESVDDNGISHYGLIDSNDTKYRQSTYIYLKRFFERKGIDIEVAAPVFDFVMISHWHTDHLQGIPRILREYGSKRVYYPKTAKNMGYLLRSVKRLKQTGKVGNYQAIDETHALPPLGPVPIKILWPLTDGIDENENNNSIVFSMKLGDHSMVFTGDAEKEVWENIAEKIPSDTVFFKVPHHGSVNGTFADDASTKLAWALQCPQSAVLGISSHIRPFEHPHRQTLDALQARSFEILRTDRHFHISAITDGNTFETRYYH